MKQISAVLSFVSDASIAKFRVHFLGDERARREEDKHDGLSGTTLP